MRFEMFLYIFLLPLTIYGSSVYDDDTTVRQIHLEDIENDHVLNENYNQQLIDAVQSTANQYLQGGVIYATNHNDEEENVQSPRTDIIYSPNVVSVPLNVDKYPRIPGVIPLAHSGNNLTPGSRIYGTTAVQNSPLFQDNKQLNYVSQTPHVLYIHAAPTPAEAFKTSSLSSPTQQQTQAFFTYNHDSDYPGIDQPALQNNGQQIVSTPYYQNLQILQKQTPEIPTYSDEQQKYDAFNNNLKIAPLQYITKNDINFYVPQKVKPHPDPLETLYVRQQGVNLYKNENFVGNSQVPIRKDVDDYNSSTVITYSHLMDNENEFVYAPNNNQEKLKQISVANDIKENHQHLELGNEYSSQSIETLSSVENKPIGSLPHLPYKPQGEALNQKFAGPQETSQQHNGQSNQQAYAPKRTDSKRTFPYPQPNIQVKSLRTTQPPHYPSNANNIPYPPSFISITSTTPQPNYLKHPLEVTETPRQWQKSVLSLPPNANQNSLNDRQINNYGRGLNNFPKKSAINVDSIQLTTPSDFTIARPTNLQHSKGSREQSPQLISNNQYQPQKVKPVKDLFSNREAKSLLDSYIPSWIVVKEQSKGN